MIQHINAVFWVISVEPRKVLYASPQHETIWGQPIETVYQDPLAFLNGIHPEDRERVVAALPSQVQGDYDQTYRVVRPDGHIRWVRTRAFPVRDAAGGVYRIAGISEDVTDRHEAEGEVRRLNRELEERVRKRTQELAAANDDLESFNASVSHDLRAPLRAIDGFSKLLLQDHGHRLDDQGKDWLRRIRDASARMSDLIDDLLMLGRIARGALRRERVDLSALAGKIVGDLRRASPQRAVDVTIAPDLVVHGDERLLRIALENILDNAWKFTSKRDRAVVEVTRLACDTTVFVVRDNGAGFDMAYVEKLFGPFSRLHSDTEFPGTGIGLATVKRIIERHGGRVWAEGAVDRGASVLFTIPGEI